MKKGRIFITAIFLLILLKTFIPSGIAITDQEILGENQLSKKELTPPRFSLDYFNLSSYGYIIEFEEESLVKTFETSNKKYEGVRDVKRKAELVKNKVIEKKKSLNEEHLKVKNIISQELGRNFRYSNEKNLLDGKVILDAGKNKGNLIERLSNLFIYLFSQKKITGKAISDSNKEDIEVLGEFTTSFNGIALKINEEESKKILKIKGVKKIYPNRKVNAFLQDSVGIVRANDTWKIDAFGNKCSEGNSCLTGKNVKLAIIDTGVDYTHPDLGTCNKENFLSGNCEKVIGGYDFVTCEKVSDLIAGLECSASKSEDTDPMDQDGHGTHVAGIAAGKGDYNTNNLYEHSLGEVWGVAPDAKLYAYRVLANDGGFDSWIISAIERSLDPNKDSDLSDHVDIISMSLGSDVGDPDDALSKAVDNAVNLGVVVVVAAGNSGPYEQTIGSPGTARKAITVGATTKSDNIAVFSSRGPVIWENGTIIKPDIVAPGEYICSAQASEDTIWNSYKTEYNLDIHCIDNKHINISGTSMAAPIVSGVIALIKQAHPDWKPEEIKSILKGTAMNLEENINAQGYGRIDALRAVKIQKPIVSELFSNPLADGTIMINGSAAGENLVSYSLSYGKGLLPVQWTEFYSSSSQKKNDLLYPILYSTYNLNDSIYSLRLQVKDSNNLIYEDRAIFNVDNIIINNPLSNDIYRIGDLIEIRGDIKTRKLNEFLDYQIEYKKSKSEDWNSNGILSEKNEDLLATWNTSNFKESGFYTIRLRAHYKEDKKADEFVYNIYLDKDLRAGWPKRIEYGQESIFGGDLAPTVKDINNDGEKEIIFGRSRYGLNPYTTIFVYSSNASLLWKKDVGKDFVNGSFGDSRQFPSLIGDINNDGFDEILIYIANFSFDLFNVSMARDKIYAYDYKGVPLQGWPIEVSHDSYPSMILADLNNDGFKEIIIQGNLKGVFPRNPSMTIISKGKIIAEWLLPAKYKLFLGIPFYPAIGNFDSDSDLEIVVGTDYIIKYPLDPHEAAIFVYNEDGSIVQNWPVKYSQSFIGVGGSSPIVGDIDNNGLSEIIFFTSNSSAINLNVLNNSGQYIHGFPIITGYPADSPVLSDLNNDKKLEIITSFYNKSYTGIMHYIFTRNGSLLTGWPQVSYPPKSNYQSIIGDTNQDNSPDILIGSGSGYYPTIEEHGGIYVWDKNGVNISGFPKATEYWAYASPVIDDLDGDGKLELIASSNFNYDIKDNKPKNRGSVYVWDLNISYNISKLQSPAFRFNTERTGCYNCVNSLGFDGKTTDLKKISDEAYYNLVLEKIKYGLIQFLEPIEISRFKANGDLLIDNVQITAKKIKINTNNVKELNKSAKLTFYNTNFINPRLNMDGRKCPLKVCISSYYDLDRKTFSVNVTHFSTYEVVESTPNVAPTATITSPAAGATFIEPASIDIKVDASDSDGSITKVEFYNGDIKLGEDASAPYEYLWENVAEGTHALKAKAIDNELATGVSLSIAIIVKKPEQQLLNCEGQEPEAKEGTIKGISQFISGTTLITSWTYSPAANLTTPCLWKCDKDLGYIQDENNCKFRDIFNINDLKASQVDKDIILKNILNNETLLKLNNFTIGEIDLKNLTLIISNVSESRTYLIINNLTLPENKTKTIYTKRREVNSNALCIADINDLKSKEDIIANCQKILCSGTSDMAYNCSIEGGIYIVSGLRHSGVIEDIISGVQPPAGTPGGSGGGGGGGSGTSEQTFVINFEQLQKGAARELAVNDKVKFDAFGDNNHYIATLLEIKENSAIIRLSKADGTEITRIEIALREQKKINVNSDNYYDLIIKVENVSVSSRKANLSFNYLREEIIIQREEEQEKGSLSEPEIGGPTISRITKEEGKKISINLIWMGVIISIAGVILSIFKIILITKRQGLSSKELNRAKEKAAELR